jgi:hypothetical protein
MTLTPQPTPWTVLPGREIADGAGNIVQYTTENLGWMCLAANNHVKLMEMLGAVETWLRTPAASRSPEDHLLALISGASGRIGFAALASKIEDAAGPSPELDRAIANEMQIPEAAYTSSTDAALTLKPHQWSLSMDMREQINPATGQPASYTVVTLKYEDKAVTATSLTFQLAICAAALKTKEL